MCKLIIKKYLNSAFLSSANLTTVYATNAENMYHKPNAEIFTINHVLLLALTLRSFPLMFVTACIVTVESKLA